MTIETGRSLIPANQNQEGLADLGPRELGINTTHPYCLKNENTWIEQLRKGQYLTISTHLKLPRCNRSYSCQVAYKSEGQNTGLINAGGIVFVVSPRLDTASGNWVKVARISLLPDNRVLSRLNMDHLVNLNFPAIDNNEDKISTIAISELRQNLAETLTSYELYQQGRASVLVDGLEIWRDKYDLKLINIAFNKAQIGEYTKVNEYEMNIVDHASERLQGFLEDKVREKERILGYFKFLLGFNHYTTKSMNTMEDIIKQRVLTGDEVSDTLFTLKTGCVQALKSRINTVPHYISIPAKYQDRY